MTENAKVEALNAEISKLPIAGKLRLAADLADAGKPDLAKAIAERAVLEMTAQSLGLPLPTVSE